MPARPEGGDGRAGLSPTRDANTRDNADPAGMPEDLASKNGLRPAPHGTTGCRRPWRAWLETDPIKARHHGPPKRGVPGLGEFQRPPDDASGHAPCLLGLPFPSSFQDSGRRAFREAGGAARSMRGSMRPSPRPTGGRGAEPRAGRERLGTSARSRSPVGSRRPPGCCLLDEGRGDRMARRDRAPSCTALTLSRGRRAAQENPRGGMAGERRNQLSSGYVAVPSMRCSE